MTDDGFVSALNQEKELSNLIHTQKREHYLAMGKFVSQSEVNDFVETYQQFKELGIEDGIELLDMRLRGMVAINAERARQLVQGVAGLIGDRDFGPEGRRGLLGKSKGDNRDNA